MSGSCVARSSGDSTRHLDTAATHLMRAGGNHIGIHANTCELCCCTQSQTPVVHATRRGYKVPRVLPCVESTPWHQLVRVKGGRPTSPTCQRPPRRFDRQQRGGPHATTRQDSLQSRVPPATTGPRDKHAGICSTDGLQLLATGTQATATQATHDTLHVSRLRP